MLRYGCMRILYGEDFVQESILSILDHVEKVFVFWTHIPFGDVTHVEYEGKIIQFPKKFDNVLEKIQALKNTKIILIEDHRKFNDGQFTHLVNDIILPNYVKPEEILFIEPDHVFRRDQLQQALTEFRQLNCMCASTRQVELWRTPFFAVPERHGRMASMLWNLRNIKTIPLTGKHANYPVGKSVPFLKSFVHNFGFCVSEHAMYWKHLTTIAFSTIIKDTPPRLDWYEKIWKNWDVVTNNTNLEISVGYEHHLPFAFPYDWRELPELIQKRYPCPPLYQPPLPPPTVVPVRPLPQPRRTGTVRPRNTRRRGVRL